MAVQHLSTYSPEKLHDELRNLPDPKLQEIVRDGQNNQGGSQGASSYMAALALVVLEERQQLRAAAAAESHDPNSPTVADKVIAETGVSTLPVALDVPPEVASKIPRGINAVRGAPTDRPMREGVVGLPSPNMTYAAQGGIVNFAGGGSTKEEESVPSTSVLNAAQKKREARRVQRILEKQKEEIEKYRLKQLGASKYLRQLELQENYDRAYPLPPPKKKAQGGIVNLRSGGSLRDWLDKPRTKEDEEWLNYILQAESSTSLEKIRALLDGQEGEALAALATLEGDGGQSIGPMQLKGPPGSILSTDKKGDIKVPEDKTDINASVRAAERHFENLLRLNDGNVEDSLRDYNQGRTSRRRGDKRGQTEKYIKGWLAYKGARAEEAGGAVSDAPRAAFGVPEEDLQETYRRQDKLPWSAYQHPRMLVEGAGPGKRPRIIGITGGPGEEEPDTLLQREHEERRRIMQGAGEAVSDTPPKKGRHPLFPATPGATPRWKEGLRLPAGIRDLLPRAVQGKPLPSPATTGDLRREAERLGQLRSVIEGAGEAVSDTPPPVTGPQKSGIARAAELLRKSKKAEREAGRRAGIPVPEEAGGPVLAVQGKPLPSPVTTGDLREAKRLEQLQRNKALLEEWGQVPPASGWFGGQRLPASGGEPGRFASNIAEVVARTKAEAEAKDQLAGEEFSTQPVFAEPEPTVPGKPRPTSGIARVVASAKEEAEAEDRAEAKKATEQTTQTEQDYSDINKLVKTGAERLKSLPPPARKSLQTKGISPIRLALILGGLKLMSGESLGDAAEKAVAAYIKSSEYEARRLKAYDKALREEAKAKATADYQKQRIALMKEGAANKRLELSFEPQVQESIARMAYQDMVASDKSGNLGRDYSSYNKFLAEIDEDPEGELAVTFNRVKEGLRRQFLKGHRGSGSDEIISIQKQRQY